MFTFLKNIFSSTYAKVTSIFSSIFTSSISQETLNELEKTLLSSDFGGQATLKIIKKVQELYKNNPNAHGSDIKKILETELLQMLKTEKTFDYKSDVLVFLGINGSGKTTTCIKLAHHLREQGEKVLLVAADTFRAAARDQLEVQAQKYDISCFNDPSINDPSAVVYKACEYAKKNNFTKVIIDTAGRLQTKVNLMHELVKMTNVIKKNLEDKTISFLLTLDSTLGQNSLNQAQTFHEAINLNGLILTKCDAHKNSGAIFSIVDTIKVPVAYITYGESISMIDKFHGKELVDKLLG